ncbi:MAG: hypothetical protein M1817_005180 [Caeruleum heppii]|nr:MAG: hypothetical protein M1817_005180 [Caeruleum heppii]
MATAQIEVPSHDRAEPGSYTLRVASYPDQSGTLPPRVEDVAKDWVTSFNSVIDNADFTALSELFLAESFWRDQLCLTWNFHTLVGPQKMTSFLQTHESGCRLKSVALDFSSDYRRPTASPIDFAGTVKGIQAFLSVETDVGKGRGVVRLFQQPGSEKWKAFTLFTCLQELRGHEEASGLKRPVGVEHGGNPGRKNWMERRKADCEIDEGREPAVLILGAGQGGLTAAARLKLLGVEALIVDRNTRIGDNWRNRYHQLVLHDPVWYDHLPYVPFPAHWPIFTPKDKLGDWFESYAQTLELNVWMGASLTDAEWDESKKQWTVTVQRNLQGKTSTRTFHPKHIIQATGHSGEPNFPSDLAGLSDFRGDRLVHSSQFTGAPKDGHGKKAVVVGCCNSAHDIAQDFYEKGFEVTMVQRSSTCVISNKAVLEVLLAGLYQEGGPPTEDADLTFMSIPNPLLKRINQDATAEISRRDASLYEGLTKAGFKLDNGPDESGMFMKYFQRGGGYYIDVGASALITSGRINIAQGHAPVRVEPHGLTLANSAFLPADEIVFATGYRNMRGTAAKIFGDEVADKMQDVWGFDEEGEVRTMWRRSGHEGFWFMGGNLALCRWYSRALALQIKALEVGLMSWDDA